MTPDAARKHILDALYSVAPDLEGEPLDATSRFRDQFEFDSMDFLRFVIALHKATGVEIPESDYPKLESLDGALGYLVGKASSP